MTGLHPGVYIEEVPSGAKPIEGASTSIAAFVGQSRRGRPNEPVLLHSWSDYLREFGPIADEGDSMGLALSAYYLNGGRDAYVVRVIGAPPTASVASYTVKDAADQNQKNLFKVKARSLGSWGNSIRLVIEPAENHLHRFTLTLGHWDGEAFVVDESFKDLDMIPSSDRYLLNVVNSNSALVEIELVDAASLYKTATLTVGIPSDLKDRLTNKDAVLTLNLNASGFRKVTITKDKLKNLPDDLDAVAECVATELQLAVSESAQRKAYTEFTATFDKINKKFILKPGGDAWGTSIAVRASADLGDTVDLYDKLGLDKGKVEPCDTAVQPGRVTGDVAGGKSKGQPLANGLDAEPDASDYKKCFDEVLKKISDISILLLPGVTISETTIVDSALSHCEDDGVRNRMLILDPPATAVYKSADDFRDLGVKASSYAVLYYPSLRIDNPLHDPRTRPNSTPVLAIGPAASVAGIWAKTDSKRGVWKAPAGVEAGVLGVLALTQNVGDGEQDQLNPVGVNCLRKMPGFGPVVWGSRTLSTLAEPEWRYVPVRRTAIMIEQSIRNSIQWAVFEPNDQRLWASLRVNIESFLNGLWRSGAFQGAKSSDAYFVRCNLGDTMTQGDIDAGRVIVEVGFAPLKPAEFVIVRIQQKVAQQ